jgi:hypothetical protein
MDPTEVVVAKPVSNRRLSSEHPPKISSPERDAIKGGDRVPAAATRDLQR